MSERVRDPLVPRAGGTFVGRSAELSELLGVLDDEPRLIFVHGLAGIGKSTLIDTFAERARIDGATVVTLDCRAIEPTARGFLYELGSAIGGAVSNPEEAAERLGRLGRRVVLSLDNYEVFRLMDTWMRQVFVPLLPDNVRVILVGRDRPVMAWLVNSSWSRFVSIIALGPLNEAESVKLLVDRGMAAQAAGQIIKFAHGHPLALKLAVCAAAERQLSDGGSAYRFHGIVEDLTGLYLTDVRDALTRNAIEAASVVRRTTLSLLRAMLPDAAPRDVLERLQALPFVENERDGLRIHDLVQEVIAASLRASDPARHQEYRRAAWRQLNAEVRSVGLSNLWRYTADLLFLIENPVVRESFFPSGAQEYVVEPARADDFSSIEAISRQHEGPVAADLIDMWWQHAPGSFHVVRELEGTVTGFYLMFDPVTISSSLLRDDPLIRVWWQHMRDHPIPKHQRALFLRRWLSRDHGEAPSPVQAASWLDIKRSYLEMRPNLRRVYLTVTDLSAYAPVAQKLGFQSMEHAEIAFDGVEYTSAMLDFGPSSVDGWLAGLAANELGVEADALLDIDAHELVLEDGRVRLSKREFDVFFYLYQSEGKAVTRASLIENVWGYKHTGSNVVDATVRSLRQKLGAKSAAIETIRGSGYRFHKL